MSTKSLSRMGLLAGSLIGIAALAACGSPATTPGGTDDPSGSGGSAPATSAPAASESPSVSASESESQMPADGTTDALTLKLSETDLGEILVDGEGMTLYMFTKDSPGMSACEGQCLQNWPPLIGEPAAGEGVDESLLGTIERSDGEMQASYNEWPLYYWVGDTEPGQTTGQDVQQVWYVLGANGEPIK
jgi:predicted lipoprotein with Yx(FWY)xxD motif